MEIEKTAREETGSYRGSRDAPLFFAELKRYEELLDFTQPSSIPYTPFWAGIAFPIRWSSSEDSQNGPCRLPIHLTSSSVPNILAIPNDPASSRDERYVTLNFSPLEKVYSRCFFSRIYFPHMSEATRSYHKAYPKNAQKALNVHTPAPPIFETFRQAARYRIWGRDISRATTLQ